MAGQARRIEPEPSGAGTGSRPATAHPAAAPAARARSIEPAALVTVGALVLAATVLRAYRLGEPIRGFMGWNEGYYASIALKDLARPLLAPLLSPLDPSQPPLYGVLLALLARVTGGSLLAARWLSVAASALMVPIMFDLARRLYNTRIALVAATVTALAPGIVILGRNVQIDAIMIAIEVAFAYAWVRSVSDGGRWPVLAAALLTLGLLAKLPFLLAVVCVLLWDLWRAGPRELLAKRVRVTLGFGLIVPAAWFLYRMLTSQAWRTAQGGFADYAVVQNLGWLYKYVFLEMAWMLSLLVVPFVIGGLIVATVERRPADKLVIAWIAVHFCAYLVFNYHTYYYVPLVPFAGLAAGRAIWSAGARSLRGALAASIVLALVLTAFSMFMLAEKKYSPWSPSSIPGDLARQGYDARRVNVLVQEEIRGQYDQAFGFSLPGYPIVSSNATDMPLPGAKRLLLSWGYEDHIPVATTWRLENTWVLFGYAIGTHGGNFNWFAPNEFAITKVGPAWRFGMHKERIAEWGFFDLES